MRRKRKKLKMRKRRRKRKWSKRLEVSGALYH